MAHYLLGLRALGYDVWFYEDTGHDSLAYNPATGAFDSTYSYGIAAVADFLSRLGLGERWLFVDVDHGLEYGPGAQRVNELLTEAELFINLRGMNSLPLERRGGRPSVYIDCDPAGRPVVEQDTGFGDVLPLGPGPHALRTVEDAAAAVQLIETDYERASAHAIEVAQEYFAAEKVLAELLGQAGF